MQLACEIRLIWPDCCLIEESTAKWVTLRGALPLNLSLYETVQRALIEIRIGSDWMQNSPRVWCQERWMKVGADWHAGEDGIICYELGLRWSEQCQIVRNAEGVKQVAKYAATWLTKSVAWLVYHHHIAHATGIDKWPSEWPFWPHNDDGVALYRREQRRNLKNGTA